MAALRLDDAPRDASRTVPGSVDSGRPDAKSWPARPAATQRTGDVRETWPMLTQG